MERRKGGRNRKCCAVFRLADVAMLSLTWHLLGSAGEMLAVAEPLLEKNFHPTVICRGPFTPPSP